MCYCDCHYSDEVDVNADTEPPVEEDRTVVKPVVVNAPPEAKIVSVANALSMGADPEDIKKDLRAQGFSEYGIFLTLKAAETHNVMRDRVFDTNRREHPTTRMRAIREDK